MAHDFEVVKAQTKSNNRSASEIGLIHGKTYTIDKREDELTYHGF